MVLTIDVQSDAAVEWHLTDTGVRTDRNRTYTPTMYVGGEKDSLDQLRELVASDPKVQDTAYEPWFHSLDADQQTPALRVDLAHVDDVRSFAHEVRHHYERTAFRPTTFRLYNVDFLPQFRYCLETGTDPTPPRALRTLRLTLGEKALADGDVSQLRVGGDPVAGDAATVLRVVNSRLTATDPDVLVLSSARLVPLLSTAAERDGLSEFALGRRPGYTKLAGESTFESYGRVGHSPARYKVPGRAIIDTSNSFLHGKAGLPGLLDLVERSWKPLQETAWGSIGNILTAIHIREALARDMLIPWNKWDGEAFKSVETLHAADRGGFIFEPAVGIHEDVVEIDFASLYPNIMCEYNVSPETVDCDCHDGADVPGLGYAICEERGFIPDVLRPLIDDRERFKGRLAATDDPEQAARLAAKADALRWILVSCFGYQGYRNAKFGRIECHEAINAFAREILLDAKETLEANGWRIVHGIVDSLWVTARSDADQVPIRQLCERISEAAGIRLEYENTFDWVAFVPKRDSAAGALTKYFGKIRDSDEFKIRGIEARQRSTPSFVASVQERLLDVVDDHREPELVCDVLGRQIRRLRQGNVTSEDLVITTRVSKRADAYPHETATVAALKRAENQGVPRAPGQDVRYVVVDDAATGPERVRLAFEDPAEYDAEVYERALLRAGESVLAPLGWRQPDIQRYLADGRDLTLDAFH